MPAPMFKKQQQLLHGINIIIAVAMAKLCDCSFIMRSDPIKHATARKKPMTVAGTLKKIFMLVCIWLVCSGKPSAVMNWLS